MGPHVIFRTYFSKGKEEYCGYVHTSISHIISLVLKRGNKRRRGEEKNGEEGIWAWNGNGEVGDGREREKRL